MTERMESGCGRHIRRPLMYSAGAHAGSARQSRYAGHSEQKATRSKRASHYRYFVVLLPIAVM